MINAFVDKFETWRRQRFFEKKLIPILFDQEIGLFKFGCRLDDPDAEQKFLTWVEARVKMARKPSGSTSMQLHCFPLLPLDPPLEGEEWKQLAEWTITFRWEDYQNKKGEIRNLLPRARELGAEAIGAVMLNSGDALLELVRQMKSGKK